MPILDVTTPVPVPAVAARLGTSGQQPEVRITGRNAKRVLLGAINPRTGTDG
ncbi:hypothetical protein [Gemmata massiliana]|uniref:hypothetical protein n=1 Tax=Gemmata massiliana TaxID=1210884 RepID=UPI0013A6A6F9|nr:hypothetical protein [Gemmata massiliana]